MGICTSNKETAKSANIKPSHSQASLVSVQTAVPINYISKKTLKEDVNSYFEIGQFIGRGNYGIVREANEKSTNLKYAIKTVGKNLFEEDKIEFIKREIDISLSTHHDHIIKCHKVFEDAQYVHFVFDLIDGGDLFDYVIQSDNMCISEQQASLIMAQIFDALHYLHNNHIVHRDIKLENFLISTQQPHELGFCIKLIDFGFAARTNDGDLIEKMGSLSYLAPELFTATTYNNKIDVWAAGIVMYNILSGRQPFTNCNETDMISEIVGKEVTFDYPQFSKISVEGKDLILQLLKKKPEERVTAFQARNHIWFTKMGISDNNLTVRQNFSPDPTKIQEILKNVSSKLDMKRAISKTLMKNDLDLDLIIENLVLKSLNELKEGLSKNLVCLSEILLYLISNCDDETIKSSLNQLLRENREVLDRSKINYYDFFKTLQTKKNIVRKERLWQLFQQYDVEHKSYLTIEQIKELFKHNKKDFNSEKIKEILRMNLLHQKNSYTFDDMVTIWENEESTKDEGVQSKF